MTSCLPQAPATRPSQWRGTENPLVPSFIPLSLDESPEAGHPRRPGESFVKVPDPRTCCNSVFDRLRSGTSYGPASLLIAQPGAPRKKKGTGACSPCVVQSESIDMGATLNSSTDVGFGLHSPCDRLLNRLWPHESLNAGQRAHNGMERSNQSTASSTFVIVSHRSQGAPKGGAMSWRFATAASIRRVQLQPCRHRGG